MNAKNLFGYFLVITAALLLVTPASAGKSNSKKNPAISFERITQGLKANSQAPKSTENETVIYAGTNFGETDGAEIETAAYVDLPPLNSTEGDLLLIYFHDPKITWACQGTNIRHFIVHCKYSKGKLQFSVLNDEDEIIGIEELPKDFAKIVRNRTILMIRKVQETLSTETKSVPPKKTPLTPAGKEKEKLALTA